jgi:signal transduction histidine kinase
MAARVGASLQARCLGALLALVAVVCAIFVVAASHSVELLEEELLSRTLDAHMRHFRDHALTLGLAALAVATCGSWILTRAIMKPLTVLVNKVAALDPHARGERLGGRFGDREVGLIAKALDACLERLDRVRERELAFTEDASHELRTPLAIVSAASELLMEEPTLSHAARERLLEIRRTCGRMQSAIEALLSRARNERVTGCGGSYPRNLK